MSLKSIFNSLKHEGYLLKDLDLYLLSLNNEEDDRATTVNSPSQVSNCLRCNYYARTGAESDVNSVDARTRRIFDNGHHTHARLQEYLLDCGKLLMDEVPLRNDEYNIQGHTDGLLKLSIFELGILEIKSINTINFSSLKDAKEEHKEQAMIYLYCAESRRVFLKEKYKTIREYKNSLNERIEYYKSLYPHLVGGKKYTKEEKINKKVEEHIKADDILYKTVKPINKVIFLYEDKNTQELKEFVVPYDEELVQEILERYSILNECVKNKDIPEREGTSKSCPVCRFCNYKNLCWVL